MWRHNKYNAQWCVYEGIRYHSKKEAEYAMILDDKLKKNEIKNWKRQIRFPLKVNDVLVASLIIDFEIENLDGNKELIEIKGVETVSFKIKKKLFSVLYPNVKLTILK